MKRGLSTPRETVSQKKQKEAVEHDYLGMALLSVANATVALSDPRCAGMSPNTLAALRLRIIPDGMWLRMNLDARDYFALYQTCQALRRMLPLLVDWRAYALNRAHGIHVPRWTAFFAPPAEQLRNRAAIAQQHPEAPELQHKRFWDYGLFRAAVRRIGCTIEGKSYSACGCCYQWFKDELMRCYFPPIEWLISRDRRVKHCFGCWEALYALEDAVYPDWASPMGKMGKRALYTTQFFGQYESHLEGLSNKARWTANATPRVKAMIERDEKTPVFPTPPKGLPYGTFRTDRRGALLYRLLEDPPERVHQNLGKSLFYRRKKHGQEKLGYMFQVNDVEKFYRELLVYILRARAGYDTVDAKRLAYLVDLKTFSRHVDWVDMEYNVKKQVAVLVANEMATAK